ncbi:hypothetical protein H4Q26_012803 [Puccinia striiformis f. sp. tritici PST-130]|nr:hypothetical protein H4Q26_012803 [Puccinia striiformis f. sp. tritici PST-130]
MLFGTTQAHRPKTTHRIETQSPMLDSPRRLLRMSSQTINKNERETARYLLVQILVIVERRRYVIRARYREFDAWRHVLDTLANIGAPVPGLRMATPQQTARPTAHFPLNLARGTPSAVLCEAYQEGSPSHEYYCSSFLSLCLKLDADPERVGKPHQSPRKFSSRHQSSNLSLLQSEASQPPHLFITTPFKMMANSSETSYFSFPSYESHFINEIQVEEPTPVTSTPFYMALEPLVDVSTEAFPSFSAILTAKPKHNSSSSSPQQAWLLPSRNSRAQSTSAQSLPHLAPVPSSPLGLHPSLNPSKAGGDLLRRGQSSNHDQITHNIKTGLHRYPDHGLPSTLHTFGFNYCHFQAFNAGSPLRLHHEHRLHKARVRFFCRLLEKH